MILMIDNYDSFTYNLVQYLMMLGSDVKVIRNDAASIKEIEDLRPLALVISPGPGRPEKAGLSIEIIKNFAGRIPILGVCLGHQAITIAFGGKIIKAKKLMHGKTSMVNSDGKSLFKSIPNPFEVMRYHSLVASKKDIPQCLEVTAESDDGEIMGVRHKQFDIEGIQFHPESIMTRTGKRILRNFIKKIDQN